MILFIQDFVRTEHLVKTPDGETRADYLGTTGGKKLKGYLKQVEIPKSAYDVTYAFPQIPQAKAVDREQ